MKLQIIYNHYFRRKPLKSCPLCGNKWKRTIRQVLPKTIKPYSIECDYCHFTTKRCMTKWGAVIAWQKSDNIVKVTEKV